MAKKQPTQNDAAQDPKLDPEGTQSVPVVETTQEEKTDTSTETQASEGSGQTDPQDSKEGGKDSEGPNNTGLDKEDKGKATTRKGSSTQAKLKTDIQTVAKKTFERLPIDTLYFTSDLQGFGNINDASNHAHTLDDKTIYEVNRSEDGK